jgi:hypothetical protein
VGTSSQVPARRATVVALLIVANAIAAVTIVKRAEAKAPNDFACTRDCHCFNPGTGPGNICSSLGDHAECEEQSECTGAS